MTQHAHHLELEQLEQLLESWDRPVGEEIAVGKLQWVDPAPVDRPELPDDPLAGPFMRWSTGCPVVITFDLGDLEPVQGVAIWAAAAGDSTDWPLTLLLLVSEDGQAYHHVGDLTVLDAVDHAAPTSIHGTHCFRTRALQVHGRFVRIVAGGTGSHLLLGRIEVYRGEGALLLEPLGDEPIEDLGAFYNAELPSRRVARRIRYDVEGLRALARGAAIDAEVAVEVGVALQSILEALPVLHGWRPPARGGEAVGSETPPARGGEAVGTETPPVRGGEAVGTEMRTAAAGDALISPLPLHPLHAHLFEIQAMLWRALRFPRLSIWRDLGNALETPFALPSEAASDVRIGSTAGEGDWLVLCNAGLKPIATQIRVLAQENEIAGARVFQWTWAETASGQINSLPLSATRDEDGFHVLLEPGLPLTLQIKADVSRARARSASLRVAVSGAGIRRTIRL